MDYLAYSLPVLALVPGIKQHRISLMTVRERCLIAFQIIAKQSDEHQNEVLYLLAVTIDELVLNHQPPGWQTWQSDLLQQHYAEQHIGGERFYERLAYHQRLQHRDLLKVFLACLQMGYQGQCALYDPSERQAIMAELTQQLKEEKETLITSPKKAHRPSYIKPLLVCLVLAGLCFMANEQSLAMYERKISQVVVNHGV